MPSLIPVFSLRMSRELRGRTEARAKRRGVSLNAYVLEAIETYNKLVPPIPHRADRVKFGGVLPAEPPEQSRNSLCACGSGRKFKRCCGR
jgi:uncharacterized protein YecA (UPF0149 family)